MSRVLFLVCLMTALSVVRAEDPELVNYRYCMSDKCEEDKCKGKYERKATGECQTVTGKGHVSSYTASCNSTHYSYATFLDGECKKKDSEYKDLPLGCERVIVPATLRLVDGNYSITLCDRLHRATGVQCNRCNQKPFAILAASTECAETTFAYLGPVSYTTDDSNTLTLYKGAGCKQKLFSEKVGNTDNCVALEDVQALAICTTGGSENSGAAISFVGGALLLLSSLLAFF